MCRRSLSLSRSRPAFSRADSPAADASRTARTRDEVGRFGYVEAQRTRSGAGPDAARAAGAVHLRAEAFQNLYDRAVRLQACGVQAADRHIPAERARAEPDGAVGVVALHGVCAGRTVGLPAADKPAALPASASIPNAASVRSVISTYPDDCSGEVSAITLSPSSRGRANSSPEMYWELILPGSSYTPARSGPAQREGQPVAR